MSIIMTFRLFLVFVVSCMQPVCFGMEQQLVVANQRSTRYVKLPDEYVEDIVVRVGKNDPFDLRRIACLDRQWNTITNGLWVTQDLFPLYDPSVLCTYGAKQYHGVNRALFTAIENGNHKDASLLLRNEYANPNYECEWEWNYGEWEWNYGEDASDSVVQRRLRPLTLASSKGNINMMQTLIKNGAWVNVENGFSNPVSSVIRASNTIVSQDTKKRCIQLLIESGVNMHYMLGQSRLRNYLHQAADSSGIFLIPFLVSCNINVNQKNILGDIPLVALLEHLTDHDAEMKDAVIALVKAGSDLNATDQFDWSAVRHAQENEWLEGTEIQKIILEAAAKNVEK